MHEVPVERASSADDFQRGDHIRVERTSIWHHAIVESVDKRNGEVNIIEYTNTATGFIRDNFSKQKNNKGKAKVVEGKIKLDTNEHVYVIKHNRCFDPETVVSRAKSQLGKREYNAFTNNCEHFALWCKTGISSSDQVNKVTDALKVAATRVVAEKWGEKISREVLQDIVTTYSTNTMSTGVRILLKETTGTIAGQEMLAAVTDPMVGRSLLGVTRKLGEEVAKPDWLMTEMMNPGAKLKKLLQIVSEETVTELPSVITQSGSSTTVSTTTEYVSVMRNSVFETTAHNKVTETVTKESTGVGLKCAMALEVVSAAYDLSCGYKDRREGKISQEEFQKAVASRCVTGTMNVLGSTVGATIGQAVIPIPVVGGLIGSMVGSSLGRYLGGLPFS